MKRIVAFALVLYVALLVSIDSPLKVQAGGGGLNPNGWIQAAAWNILLLNHDAGCLAGGEERIASNDWAFPYDLFEEEPQGGEQWDIDFASAESRSWRLQEWGLPVWVTTAYLNENGFGVDPHADLVNFWDYISMLGGITEDSMAIATTYIENTNDVRVRVDLCTASDDSIRVDVNDNTVVWVSSCRGSEEFCQELSCAVLEPGMNKVTAYVWSGGGGINMRLGFRDRRGFRIRDGNDLGIVFRGSGEGQLTGQRARSNSCPDWDEEPEPAQNEPEPALNGDVNGDERLDMSDAIYLLLHIFRDGPEPVPFVCP